MGGVGSAVKGNKVGWGGKVGGFTVWAMMNRKKTRQKSVINVHKHTHTHLNPNFLNTIHPTLTQLLTSYF